MRRSLRYVLLGVPLAAVVLAGGALTLLPGLAKSRLAERAQTRHGLTMSVDGGTGLSFSDGLAVTLDNVSFTRTSAQGVPSLVVGEIRVPTPLRLLVGGSIRRIELVDPVFSFVASDSTAPAEITDAAAEAAPAPKEKPVKPLAISIDNGSIKASDPQHNLAIAVTDITGELTQAGTGTLEGDLRGLFNGVATQLALTVDDTRRLAQPGSPSDITLTSKAGQVVMSGRLRLAGDMQFDGSVSAEATDAQSFLSWLGVPLEGLADGLTLGLDAGVSISQAKAQFRNLAFALGNMQAKGELSLQAASPRPALDATLAFNTVNFNIYSGSDDPGTTSPPDLTTDWREKRLPFADLKAADVSLSVTSESLMAGAVTAGPSSLKATLKDGVLQAHVESSALFSGKGSLDLTLQQGQDTGLAVALDVAGAEAKDFLGKAFGIHFLSGPVNLQTDLKATGNNPAQLISTLAGTASLALTGGSIDGIDLASLAGLISKEEAQGWGLSDGAVTPLTSATASAAFSDGIATLSQGQIEAAGLAASVSGDVDLLRRALNLTVKPERGLPLPVAARVKGPWDNPKMSAKVDVEGVLDAVGADDISAQDVKSAKKALKKLLGD